eukprot:PhM_4_TR14864/c0_g1_i1/m.86542
MGIQQSTTSSNATDGGDQTSNALTVDERTRMTRVTARVSALYVNTCLRLGEEESIENEEERHHHELLRPPTDADFEAIALRAASRLVETRNEMDEMDNGEENGFKLRRMDGIVGSHATEDLTSITTRIGDTFSWGTPSVVEVRRVADSSVGERGEELLGSYYLFVFAWSVSEARLSKALCEMPVLGRENFMGLGGGNVLRVPRAASVEYLGEYLTVVECVPARLAVHEPMKYAAIVQGMVSDSDIEKKASGGEDAFVKCARALCDRGWRLVIGARDDALYAVGCAAWVVLGPRAEAGIGLDVITRKLRGATSDFVLDALTSPPSRSLDTALHTKMLAYCRDTANRLLSGAHGRGSEVTNIFEFLQIECALPELWWPVVAYYLYSIGIPQRRRGSVTPSPAPDEGAVFNVFMSLVVEIVAGAHSMETRRACTEVCDRYHVAVKRQQQKHNADRGHGTDETSSSPSPMFEVAVLEKTVARAAITSLQNLKTCTDLLDLQSSRAAWRLRKLALVTPEDDHTAPIIAAAMSAEYFDVGADVRRRCIKRTIERLGLCFSDDGILQTLRPQMLVLSATTTTTDVRSFDAISAMSSSSSVFEVFCLVRFIDAQVHRSTGPVDAALRNKSKELVRSLDPERATTTRTRSTNVLTYCDVILRSAAYMLPGVRASIDPLDTDYWVSTRAVLDKVFDEARPTEPPSKSESDGCAAVILPRAVSPLYIQFCKVANLTHILRELNGIEAVENTHKETTVCREEARERNIMLVLFRHTISAQRIQRWARRATATRRRHKALMDAMREQDAADACEYGAVMLQSAWRRHRAAVRVADRRRRVRELVDAETCARHEMEQNASDVAAQLEADLRGSTLRLASVLRLQRWSRRAVAARRRARLRAVRVAESLSSELEQYSAVVVQSVWRGHRCRCSVNHLLNELGGLCQCENSARRAVAGDEDEMREALTVKAKGDLLRLTSALRIQRWARRATATRRRHKALMDAMREQDAADACEYGAVMLQSAWRRHRAMSMATHRRTAANRIRRFICVSKVLFPLRAERRQRRATLEAAERCAHAVVAIQSVLRGWYVRRQRLTTVRTEVVSLKTKNKKNINDETDDDGNVIGGDLPVPLFERRSLVAQIRNLGGRSQTAPDPSDVATNIPRSVSSAPPRNVVAALRRRSSLGLGDGDGDSTTATAANSQASKQRPSLRPNSVPPLLSDKQRRLQETDAFDAHRQPSSLTPEDTNRFLRVLRCSDRFVGLRVPQRELLAREAQLLRLRSVPGGESSSSEMLYSRYIDGASPWDQSRVARGLFIIDRGMWVISTLPPSPSCADAVNVVRRQLRVNDVVGDWCCKKRVIASSTSLTTDTLLSDALLPYCLGIDSTGTGPTTSDWIPHHKVRDDGSLEHGDAPTVWYLPWEVCEAAGVYELITTRRNQLEFVEELLEHDLLLATSRNEGHTQLRRPSVTTFPQSHVPARTLPLTLTDDDHQQLSYLAQHPHFSATLNEMLNDTIDVEPRDPRRYMYTWISNRKK